MTALKNNNIKYFFNVTVYYKRFVQQKQNWI